jgi:hypothetical protein
LVVIVVVVDDVGYAVYAFPVRHDHYY